MMQREQTTLVQWEDPAHVWHQPGEVGILDEALVFDWQHLVEVGTIEVRIIPDPAPDPAPAPADPAPAPTGDSSK